MILLRIEDLTMENASDAVDLCISPKSAYKHARAEKLRWLGSRLPKLAGGKLAYFDDEPAGMLEFSSVEDAPLPVSGKNILHINCILVLPRFQRRGVGSGLVRACIAEARSRGKKAVSVIAFDGPFYMPATFFEHQGLRRLQIRGHNELMWKEISPCNPPVFITRKFVPHKDPGTVMVEILCSPQCPWSIVTRQRLEKASRRLRQHVKISSTETTDRQSVERLGESRKVFVNGFESFQFPPTEDDIKTVLESSKKELPAQATSNPAQTDRSSSCNTM